MNLAPQAPHGTRVVASPLPLLDFGGFHPQADNTEQALLSLSAVYALLPCALKLAAAAVLQFARRPSHLLSA